MLSVCFVKIPSILLVAYLIERYSSSPLGGFALRLSKIM